MSFPPCPSPPPPMPSPVLVPTPLPSPSRRRLTIQSQIPLLKRTLNHALSHDALKPENRRRTIKRTHSQLPSRCRSPPPSPAVRSPPPPVPPIPAFVLGTNRSFLTSPRRPPMPNHAPALDLYLDHPCEAPANTRCESQAGVALTCMQFFAVHNPTGQCRA